MSFKASKPDARILILQIVIASILEFGFHSIYAIIALFFAFLLVWDKSFCKTISYIRNNVGNDLGIYNNKHPNSIYNLPAVFDDDD